MDMYNEEFQESPAEAATPNNPFTANPEVEVEVPETLPATLMENFDIAMAITMAMDSNTSTTHPEIEVEVPETLPVMSMENFDIAMAMTMAIDSNTSTAHSEIEVEVPETLPVTSMENCDITMAMASNTSTTNLEVEVEIPETLPVPFKMNYPLGVAIREANLESIDRNKKKRALRTANLKRKREAAQNPSGTAPDAQTQPTITSSSSAPVFDQSANTAFRFSQNSSGLAPDNAQPGLANPTVVLQGSNETLTVDSTVLSINTTGNGNSTDNGHLNMPSLLTGPTSAPIHHHHHHHRQGHNPKCRCRNITHPRNGNTGQAKRRRLDAPITAPKRCAATAEQASGASSGVEALTKEVTALKEKLSQQGMMVDMLCNIISTSQNSTPGLPQ
ncbi:hypothetical protein G7Z17_g6391 [Cylindrodendrum hubeiense]|uniref:Uncharacterized protein n=1 Tax=Cylindrodendrum hubeiense TaxID=595255 RepID=A0A9P5HCF2_9HYPO|nr:hypothetical protein G7Z17_g6391 [Cylindrodendrum hubeiense]